MSIDFLIKCFFTIIISLIISWVVFYRYDIEVGTESNLTPNEKTTQKYLPFIPSFILPLFIVALAVTGLLFYGPKLTTELIISLCFTVFLHISFYYVILILVLPFLHKYISARTCSILWLLPNFLYLADNSAMELPKPAFVLHLPATIVWTAFYIWLIGFFAVLIWKILSHFSFRRFILQDATPITDVKILELWGYELAQAYMKKPKIKLVTSPNVTTPLSIGLFSHTTYVVLPQSHYSLEELALIFRHEIIHIGREDAWSKFFLVFCTAMCWFNPLIWIAMRKSANDFELSCDETVLLHSDETTRRKYATLILNTAGNERGFTTCLSASATALQYRLQNIMNPKTKRSGALIAGVVFFILCMSCGYVALSYGDYTGTELIYRSEDTNLYTLESINKKGKSDTPLITLECTDIEALHNYLSNLTLSMITGNYSFSETENQYTFLCNTPNGNRYIVLFDDMIKLVDYKGRDTTTSSYYIPEGIDWEYLDTLLVEIADEN